MKTENNVTVLFENGFKITTITHEVEMVVFECKVCGEKGITEYFCSTDFCSEHCEETARMEYEWARENDCLYDEQPDDDKDDIHSEYLRQAELDITAGICRCCKHLDSLNEEGLCFDCYYDQQQELKPVEVDEDDLPF